MEPPPTHSLQKQMRFIQLYIHKVNVFELNVGGCRMFH